MCQTQANKVSLKIRLMGLDSPLNFKIQKGEQNKEIHRM